MSEQFKESNYENSIIELFKGMGYEYLYGPDVDRNYEDPIYNDVFVQKLRELNIKLPDEAIVEAIRKVKLFENGSITQKNETFMDYLQNGVQVSYSIKGEERSSIVYLIDYKNIDNNSFIVANQWTYIENSEKRADVIIFINGFSK